MEETDHKSNAFKKSFFRNVLISGGYNYLSQGLTFLSSIIIARLLSPSNFGLVGLITVFTGFISVFSDSGISLAIIKSDFKLLYHKSLDTLAIYMGIILFILTSILAYPITLFYGNSILLFPTIALATTFIFRSMSIVRGALIAKDLDFGYLGKVILINNVVTIILTVILAYFGAEHWSIIVPQIISSLLTVVMYEYRLKFGFKLYANKFVFVAFRHTKRTIGNLLGFNLINYWARSADNLVVGKLYGISDLGIYSRAYSLLTLPLTLITGLMGTVLYPSLKKLKNEGGEIFLEYLFILRIIQIIVFPISCILILFPNQLVSLLWGNSWIRVAELLPYFGLLVFSQPLLSTSGNILVLQGKERVLMFSGWISAFFTISGIAVGAFYSLVAIAQYYSFAFIALVLPFNVIYVYYYALGFDRIILIKFWLPIILISIGIWISCLRNNDVMKVGFLMLLFANLIWASRAEIGKAYLLIKKKLMTSINL